MLADHPAAMRTAGRVSATEALYWLALVLMPVYALLIAVPAPLLNDGFVYYVMVKSLVEHGSLAFENGNEQYGSPTLATFHFVPVDGRLMPQYPHGWAFLAAPFYALGGIRGLFALNALATVLTLWLIRVTARTLFDDDRIGLAAALLYAFATFAFDYAGAVWPHAVTIACIVGGMAASALAWRRNDLRWALFAGLVLGLGVNVRVDAILPAAALGLWLLGAAARPYRALAALLLGLVPGLVVAAALNFVKFGAFNPLTYGQSGGPTSLAHYAELVPLIVLAALGGLALGLASVRRSLARPRMAVAALAAAGVVLVLVPAFRDLMQRLLDGSAGLLFSLEFFADRGRFTIAEDGTVRLLGWHKKALLQSLPYAAVAVLLLPRLFRGPDRPGLWLCLLTGLCILLPFAYAGWVGGRGNHMRYLLHLVPALVILAAVALRQVRDAPQSSARLAVAVGLALPLAGIALGTWRGQEPLHVMQSTAAGAVAAGIALLSASALIVGDPLRRVVYAALHGAVWAGIVIAGLSAWLLDFLLHQDVRAEQYAMARALRELPENALVIAQSPTWTFERAGSPSVMVASAAEGMLYDPALLARAFANGKTVLAQNAQVAEQMVEAGDAGSASRVFFADKTYQQLFLMSPPRND